MTGGRWRRLISAGAVAEVWLLRATTAIVEEKLRDGESEMDVGTADAIMLITHSSVVTCSVIL